MYSAPLKVDFLGFFKIFFLPQPFNEPYQGSYPLTNTEHWDGFGKQPNGPTHLLSYYIFRLCKVGLNPVYPLGGIRTWNLERRTLTIIPNRSLRNSTINCLSVLKIRHGFQRIIRWNAARYCVNKYFFFVNLFLLKLYTTD